MITGDHLLIAKETARQLGMSVNIHDSEKLPMLGPVRLATHSLLNRRAKRVTSLPSQGRATATCPCCMLMPVCVLPSRTTGRQGPRGPQEAPRLRGGGQRLRAGLPGESPGQQCATDRLSFRHLKAAEHWLLVACDVGPTQSSHISVFLAGHVLPYSRLRPLLDTPPSHRSTST
jgi:hypothetical protein